MKLHFHRQIIVDEVKKLKPKSVLEVGCGEGTNLFAIKDQIRGVKVEGVDSNPEYICDFIKEGDAKKLSYKNNSFDVVVADAVLMYAENDLGQIIKEIKRIAKKGIIICDRDFSKVEKDFPNAITLPIKGWDNDWDMEGYIMIWENTTQKLIKEKPKKKLPKK